MHKPLSSILAAALLLGSLTVRATAADVQSTPQHILTHAGASHRLVFDLSTTTVSAGGINAGLSAIAALRDTFRREGTPAAQVSIVVVIHAGATDIVRVADSYRRKGLGQDNPNLALMRTLAGQGVFFIVPQQSLTLRDIADTDIDPLVHVGSSADLIFFKFEENGYVYSGTGSLFKD